VSWNIARKIEKLVENKEIPKTKQTMIFGIFNGALGILIPSAKDKCGS